MGGVKLVVAATLAVIAAAALMIGSQAATAAKALGDDYVTHGHAMPTGARAEASAKSRCGVVFHTTPAPVVRC
jgi:hypothetical protein